MSPRSLKICLFKLGQSNNIYAKNWTELARSFDPAQLSETDLLEPCIQVALYDATDEGWTNYHEIITFIVPFCDSVWCGFDANTFEQHNIQPIKCFPTRCKGNLFFLFALFIILAIAITIANLTVILVYSTEQKSRHSQGIFRLALGVADIMVGLIVFPAAVNTLWKTFQHPTVIRPSYNVTGQEKVIDENGTEIYRNSTVAVEMVVTRQQEVSELFPFSFISAIGFFNTVSLTASIYLLTVSGIDRLWAITRPVHYRQYTAKRFAKISTLVCFALAILVALLPIFLKEFSYLVTGSGLVTLTGRLSLILYAVGFFTPLLATWIIAILMFVQSRKSFKRRANLSTVRQQQILQQKRLNRILSLMVTAFSISVLPTIIILIAVIFIPNTNPLRVETYDSLLNNVANSLEIVAVVILLSNSLWNCVIYSIRTKHFRKMALGKYQSFWNFISPLRIYHMCIERRIKRRKSSKRFCASTNTHSTENGSVIQMVHGSSCHTSSLKASPKLKKQRKHSKTCKSSPLHVKSNNTKL